MVDHKAHPVVSLDRLQGRGQLARPDQQVVDEARLSDRGDSPLHVFAKEPLGVGFVVNLVPDADKTIPTALAFEPHDGFGHGALSKVYPTDHASDEVGLAGGLEKLSCLVHTRDRLHEHRLVDLVLRQQRTQLFGTKSPPNCGQLFTHPGILPS